MNMRNLLVSLLLLAASTRILLAQAPLPPKSAGELLQEIRNRDQQLPVILMTAFATVETASDDVVLAITGITSGRLVDGVRVTEGRSVTSSLLLTGRPRTVRTIHTEVHGERPVHASC